MYILKGCAKKPTPQQNARGRVSGRRETPAKRKKKTAVEVREV